MAECLDRIVTHPVVSRSIHISRSIHCYRLLPIDVVLYLTAQQLAKRNSNVCGTEEAYSGHNSEYGWPSWTRLGPYHERPLS